LSVEKAKTEKEQPAALEGKMGRARHTNGIRKAHAIVTGGAPAGEPKGWLSFEEVPGFVKERGAAGRIEIGVGHGDGTWLADRAAAEPGTQFLGIEKDGHYFQQFLRRVAERNLGNVRAVWDDAVDLARRIPPGSVDAVHFYFPDPWPKKRHHRRRFFQRDVVAALWRALKAGGAVWTATDDLEYFGDIDALMAAGFTAERFAEHWPEGVARTRYEVKWTGRQHPIRRVCYRRKDGAAPETWPAVKTSADEQIDKQRKRMLKRGGGGKRNNEK
jgi:tRNA (guanine-N7-)-methyltransferase